MLFKLLSFLPLALSASLPRSSHSPGSYDGYECLKINTHGKMDDVLGKLKDLDFHDIWKQGADFIDAVVPGFEMDHIKEMGLDFIEMHTDLGKDIAREKECDQYDGRLGLIWICPYDTTLTRTIRYAQGRPSAV